MLDRRELILKAAVGIAGALVLYELGLFIVHINPLWHVKIPTLPSLPTTPATAVAGKGTNAPAAKPGSNTTQVANAKSTNGPAQGTNVAAQASNHLAQATNSVARGTNLVARGTNLLAGATNALPHATNSLAAATATSRGQVSVAPTNNASVPPSGVSMTGSPPGGPPGMPPGMMGMGPGGGPGMPPGFMGMGPGGPSMGKPGPELPPELQARLDRVIDSEILAPVMRPLPMALLGIAGPDVFLRAPNGQTGLIKEGEELGGVKLLRIGVNRVLVEQQGEQKELTIFAGLGSESLMSAKKDSPK